MQKNTVGIQRGTQCMQRKTDVKKKRTGLVCGRFQVFHNDHLKYVLEAGKRCDHLIVGITSPDPSMSPAESADENRGKKSSNPCTYYERMQMVKRALKGAGFSDEEFDIVPFPIGRPELIRYYVPEDITCYITIYDAWGESKKERLEELGYEVQVLWHVSPEEKGISASEIRKAIASGGEWKHLVPAEVYEYMVQYGIDKRIYGMNKK
ncbi:MAG: adenylyltransferase/cytidyltransferase family protein [Lachnospiraceae bacterium]|nr:adenylyltransferase/cytidyltransferase family protein [Lachnospiraceae bacterium]